MKRHPKANQCEPGTPYHSSVGGELSGCTNYVIEGNREAEDDERAEDKEDHVAMQGSTVCLASVPWLLECVASLQLIDPLEYMRDVA